MIVNDATEAAYKHGYEDGYIAAVKQILLIKMLGNESNEVKENEQDT